MTGIASAGNPWLQDPQDRANWAKDLNVKVFTEDTELLYFPCCTPAFDPGAKRIAQATVKVLKKVGADFGILGSEEKCCGESVRKLGNEPLFENLAKANINTFEKHKVKKIIVSSPHCFHAFKNEYPEFGGSFEVVHFAPYLAQLLKEGRLKFTREYKKRVAYQDPCYLGHHNGIYDEPRAILRSIPGLELVEMRSSHESSICCGGGGGRIWMETKKEEMLANLRLEEAIQTGAEVLAVACPYCMLNFDGSVLAMEKGEIIEIKDIAEIVLEAI
ncbi:MAG: (Fe-S)-binding protein [Dehalococcoidia bacterium]